MQRKCISLILSLHNVLGVEKFGSEFAVKHKNFVFRAHPWIKIPFKGYDSANDWIIFQIVTTIGVIWVAIHNYTIAFQDVYVTTVKSAQITTLSINSKTENGFMYFQLSSNQGYNMNAYIPYAIYSTTKNHLDEYLSYDFEIQS